MMYYQPSWIGVRPILALAAVAAVVMIGFLVNSVSVCLSESLH